MTERAEEIAQELLGTSQDVSDACDAYEYENLELMSEIDQFALRCTECSWWFEPEEMVTTDGDCICNECFEGA